MPKYIVADPATGNGWGHIFASKETGVSLTFESSVRFVFDGEENRIVHMDVDHRSNDNFIAATELEIADVEDSLKNANPEALEKPGIYGLITTDELPEWADKATPAPSI